LHTGDLHPPHEIERLASEDNASGDAELGKVVACL
jgi:hypothetical protein